MIIIMLLLLSRAPADVLMYCVIPLLSTGCTNVHSNLSVVNYDWAVSVSMSACVSVFVSLPACLTSYNVVYVLVLFVEFSFPLCPILSLHQTEFK